MCAVDNRQSDNIKNILNVSRGIYEKYEWLLNAYVLDFFTEKHWEKLPAGWKTSLRNIDPEVLGAILNFEEPLRITAHVLPLSLLTLRRLLKTLNLPRKTATSRSEQLLRDNHIFFNEKIMNMFWKHVKLKKRHEICLMAEMCHKSSIECDTNYILDVGSGLGHLARLLSYGYGLKVCGLELQGSLTVQAQKLDAQFEQAAWKHYCEELKYVDSRPVHVNVKIEPSTDANSILEMLENAFRINRNELKCGIVGLHPCGDLGATLLRLFNSCPQIKFINIVGCCYMKLTTDSTSSANPGYPLSYFCKENSFELGYHSREIACHAIETYVDRLNFNQHEELKIHAYRAAIEKLIVTRFPHLKHSQLQSVKYSPNLTFPEYCNRALAKLNMDFSHDEVNSREIDDFLSEWNSVVTFYSLRLLLAPLIETMILLDRVLFVLENGAKCKVEAIFDPRLSPRSHVLTGTKI